MVTHKNEEKYQENFFLKLKTKFNTKVVFIKLNIFNFLHPIVILNVIKYR